MRGKRRIPLLTCILLLGLFLSGPLHAQDPDSTRVTIGSDVGMDSLHMDSTKIIEDAALDIGQDRGLFIVTPDSKMQLRILGSVRYLVVYDDMDLSSKNNLISYEIPTGQANQRLPNYFNGLTQSRLGFEITRYTPGGNVFIRLETDFAGTNGFRIRHAYGQYNRFLFGQTWSLFSHIASLPATVGFAGPIAGVSVRTPQIRYTMRNLLPEATLTVGMEYFTPEFELPDSLAVKAFQLLPDFTARIEKNMEWGSMELSGIVPIISGRTGENEYVIRLGWGAAFSTVVDSWAGGRWYIHAAGGQAISRFFGDLSGQGLDLVYDPDINKSYLPLTWGGYLTYEHHWSEKLFSNFTYGILFLETKDLSPDDTYFRGGNIRVNTFWSIVEGARMGIEYIYATKMDKGGAIGTANRVNLLFYYDF